MAVAEDVTNLYDDKVDLKVAANFLPRAALVEAVEDEPKSARGTRDESGLFACLGFSVKTVDTHAELVVEDTLPVGAKTRPALPLSRRTGRSGRSVQVGTTSGMLGYGVTGTSLGMPASGAAPYEEVPILLQPSFVIAELKDELLGLVATTSAKGLEEGGGKKKNKNLVETKKSKSKKKKKKKKLYGDGGVRSDGDGSGSAEFVWSDKTV